MTIVPPPVERVSPTANMRSSPSYENDSPVKQQYMNYFKFGDGPLYVFYTPYHLPHLQVAVTIGRVALFHDAAVTPLGAPVCEVPAIAKRHLRAGEALDGIGGFTLLLIFQCFAKGFR